MNTHNICFCGEIRKILCGFLLLYGAMSIRNEGVRIFRENTCPKL